MDEQIIRAACAAFFSGQGYAACTDFTIPGTDIIVDVAAVLPRMRDLKARLKRGFVPVGILRHLLNKEWVPLREIISSTGFEPGYVITIFKEAAAERWIEFDNNRDEPCCRILDYRPPAKECLLAFSGMGKIEDKIAYLKELDGCYSQALFIFPYPLDIKTTERIASLGAGIVQYYKENGVFQKLVPPDTHDIEDQGRFAMIVEYLLYKHVWVQMGEII